MRAIRNGLVTTITIGLLAGSAVGIAAQTDETEPPGRAVWTGYFANFTENAVQLEVPEFIVTFPDGGEAP
jgi:hypothetical protein